MNRLICWIAAFRLRTLALSFALIITSSAIAVGQGIFSWSIFLWALLTTLFLQILSNLSNDYGDSASGVDEAWRIGPMRAVQSGAISLGSMRRAIYLFAILSLLSGLALLYASMPNIGVSGIIIMLGVGLICIAAAITYTVGKKPYGYMGLGDAGVFIFFGLVGVMGSYVLYAGRPDIKTLMPASAIGLLSVGVLNMNNLRDYGSDKASGKRTLVVMMGTRWARAYQAIIISLSILLFAAYIFAYGHCWQWLCAAVFPILVRHIATIRKTDDHNIIDAQLKILSLSALCIAILFMVGTVISASTT